MRAIPLDLRLAIGVGIGLFIAFVGAVKARTHAWMLAIE